MIHTVILWQNGMIMVHDEHGTQMPDYQGRTDTALIAKIERDAPNSATFTFGKWRGETLQAITKAEWLAMATKGGIP